MPAQVASLEGAFQCLFGFGVDYGQRHRVEVRTHAVHTKADHAEILFSPVEGSVEVAYVLPSAIHGARHVVEEVSRGEACRSRLWRIDAPNIPVDVPPYGNGHPVHSGVRETWRG